jgi:CRISPR-associated protein Cmr4
MYKKSEIFYIHAIAPMHVGSGQDLGIVDMPIQRESHTNYPKIEGSSLKGSIREAFENEAKKEKDKNDIDEIQIHLVFGYDETNASEEAKQVFKEKGQYAGAIGFSDARILLFPVKSVKGTFAWITCPYVLKRFKKDLEICGVNETFEIPNENTITNNSKIKVDDNVVILEEYSFEVKEDEKTTKLAEFLAKETKIDEIKEKLIVLEDDVFKDFVTQFTEVITRTKIDNSTGTVKDGALFTEEYLPAESVMYSLVMASDVFAPIDEDKKTLKTVKDVLGFFKKCPNVIQIGANATIGKGVCEIITKDENE